MSEPRGTVAPMAATGADRSADSDTRTCALAATVVVGAGTVAGGAVVAGAVVGGMVVGASVAGGAVSGGGGGSVGIVGTAWLGITAPTTEARSAVVVGGSVGSTATTTVVGAGGSVTGT